MIISEPLRFQIDRTCRVLNWEFRKEYHQDAINYGEFLDFVRSLDNEPNSEY